MTASMKFETRAYHDLRLASESFKNPRARSGLSNDALVELALHIGRNGLGNPLRVTPDGVITAGQRRYRALGVLINWRAFLLGKVEDDEIALFDQRGLEYHDAVPVILDETVDEGSRFAKALADNLMREDMCSYDVAESIVALVDRGDSQRKIANEIGRDPSFVSRMVTSWRSAIPELHVIWASGQISFEEVYELTRKPAEEQRQALMAQPQSRGPHGRPGIDRVKRLLERAKRNPAGQRARADLDASGIKGDPYYHAGVVDALRVVTGELDIAELEGLLE